jgi:hypothetical protein
MKACSSEMAIDFQRTTRLSIPDDRTLHNHRCENLQSYKVYVVLQSKETYTVLNLVSKKILAI